MVGEEYISTKSEKERRKERWKEKPPHVKRKIILEEVARGISFVFCVYGVYKLPDVLFSFFGWNTSIAHIISFALFCITAEHITTSPSAYRYKFLNNQRAQLVEDNDTLSKSIEEAVWTHDISPLLKLCDEEYLSHAKASSVYWKTKSSFGEK